MLRVIKIVDKILERIYGFVILFLRSLWPKAMDILENAIFTNEERKLIDTLELDYSYIVLRHQAIELGIDTTMLDKKYRDVRRELNVDVMVND